MKKSKKNNITNYKVINHMMIERKIKKQKPISVSIKPTASLRFYENSLSADRSFLKRRIMSYQVNMICKVLQSTCCISLIQDTAQTASLESTNPRSAKTAIFGCNIRCSMEKNLYILKHIMIR